MIGRESAIRWHARVGPKAMRIPIAGRLAVSALIWFVLAFSASQYGLVPPGLFALVGLIVLEVLYWLIKWKRARKQMKQAVSLQSQLHGLKQQEFDLRYKQAKQDGTLRRFGQKEPET